MYESLRMGVHGLVWVRMNKFTQRGAKTSQKEEQIRDQDMFSRAITLQNIYRTLVLQINRADRTIGINLGRKEVAKGLYMNI